MPKVKKPKSSSDSDSGPEDRTPQPAAKKAKSGGGDQGDAGKQWTLEKLRQVRINEFRGRQMVDIREFYEKDGNILPGKKGISLSITQWKKLVELAPEIDKALKE